MRYWNKQKAAREHWTLVRTNFNFGPDWQEKKLWCQRNGSKGRFYSGPYRTSYWYFENSEDALAFKLTWIGPN